MKAIMFVFVLIVASLMGCYSQKNISSVITKLGYPLEVYSPKTEDGYYIELFRLNKNLEIEVNGKQPVVLLQHGLGSCCADWFLNSAEESLGFILADKGYDVWVGNNRGNGYSMKNDHFTPNQPSFWNWTYDEMALYDLETEIDFILQKTGRETLSYVGISQGTAQVFAALSSLADLGSKMNIFVALAPVAHVYHQRSLLLSALAELDIGEVVSLLGVRDFDLPTVVRKLLPGICEADPSLCEYAISLEVGPSTYLNKSRIPFYIDYEMAPTSIWNMIHWSQGVKKNVFQKMDWGMEENIKRYGTPTPPPYELSKVASSGIKKVAFFTGGEDYLADPQDVELLEGEIHVPVSDWFEPKYSHIDYVISTEAHKQIYPAMIKMLESANAE